MKDLKPLIKLNNKGEIDVKFFWALKKGRDVFYVDLYNKIMEKTSFLNSNTRLIQRLWHIYFNVNYNIKCNQCNKKPPHFMNFIQGYRKYCSNLCQRNHDKHFLNSSESHIKSKETRRKRGYKEIVKKCKLTKLKKYGSGGYNNRDKYKETCLEKYGKDSTNRVEKILSKQREKRIDKGTYSSDPQKYKLYRDEVVRLTDKLIKKLKLFEKEGVKRGYFTYQIDHKLSVMVGFNFDLHPYIVSHPFNLQVLFWKDNQKKHFKSSLTLRQLIEGIGKEGDINTNYFLKLYNLRKIKEEKILIKNLEEYFDYKKN